MSLSYAAHINGDKVYDIATGYWIEAKQEPSSTAGKVKWNVYLYDDEGEVAEKYEGADINEADKDKWLFAGFDMNINTTNASWRIFLQSLPSYNIVANKSGTSATLKQYFSGEQGYAINADYAVIDVQPLAVSDNGVYTAPFSKAYSPVTVDVQEQPWQPLEDGYSNFWFELTNDTLSPWLNFSAKTKNAVIDWGDGSGEVALDTLTPTHTYAKAGKYVVKVKGVTGIVQMRKGGAEMLSKDMSILKAAELNSEVTTLADRAFQYQAGLEHISFTTNLQTIGTYAFEQCSLLRTIPTMNANTTINSAAFRWMLSLETINFPSNTTIIYANTCYQSVTLKSVTIPATVTSIGAGTFQNCYTLATIHMLPTTPPTVGGNAFVGLQSDYIIYVPVGYGETYKAAAGWSTYADHILEEGQTPNRAMLSRLAKAVDTDEDMR